MNKGSTNAKLETAAWLLSGLTGSTPGALSLADGRLTYTVYGRGSLAARHCRKLERECRKPGLAQRLNDEEDVVLFDEPLDAARFSFPWYTFGGGMNASTEHARFRFSFLRPANTMTNTGAGLSAGRNILEGRAAGKQWRQLLG